MRDPENYCVDGFEFPGEGDLCGTMDNESGLAGDGQYAPFLIFDIDAQDYLPGQYATRDAAEAAMAAFLAAP